MVWLVWFCLLVGSNALFCVEDVKLKIRVDLFGVAHSHNDKKPRSYEVNNGDPVHSLKKTICDNLSLNATEYLLKFESTILNDGCQFCDYGLKIETLLYLVKSSGFKSGQGSCPKKYNPETNKLWWNYGEADNLRCGSHVSRLPNGRSPICNPNSFYYCCSPRGWCGNSTLHCHGNSDCVDYRASKYNIDAKVKTSVITSSPITSNMTDQHPHLEVTSDLNVVMEKLNGIGESQTNLLKSSARLEETIKNIKVEIDKITKDIQDISKAIPKVG